jgi:hypothetical protein
MATTAEIPAGLAETIARNAARGETARATASDGAFVRFILTVGIYAIPLLVTLRPVGTPICDPDLWWHLRVGQWVYQHRAVPTTDPFSAFGQYKPWVAYSWLYELLVFGLHSALGLLGVVVYRAILALGVTAAVHRLVMRDRPAEVFGASLTAVCLLPLAMLFSERPWLFTILFGTITLQVVLALRDGRSTRAAWLLPVVFAVWANVHIQFVYGLALLGLACTTPVIDRLLHGVDDGSVTAFGSPAWRKTVVLSFACLLATFVNPYGPRLYAVVVEYATQSGPFQFVNELKAPEFREPCDWVMLGLTVVAAFVLGRRRRLGSFEVLLLAGSAVLSFRSRRDLWLADLAACAILSARPLGASSGARAERWTVAGRTALAVSLLLLAVGVGLVRNLTPVQLQRTADGVFPAAAARFVADHGYQGPLFNDFNWGGYLIFALPALPVAIDGRTNLHGDERILRYGSVWAGAPGWQEDPDLRVANVVIANVQCPLANLLAHDDRFEVVYEDELARVFVARAGPRP